MACSLSVRRISRIFALLLLMVAVISMAACGGSSSATPPPETSNPTPSVSALNPSSGVAGGPAFTLEVTGSNFISASRVRWNGADRTTTFVNATTLQAQILASDVAASGSANVTVFNPAPGGGSSGSVAFAINNPAPVVNALTPNATTINVATEVTVGGNGFVASSVVQVGGTPRTTTFISSTQLRVTLTAADVAAVGSLAITVVNPTPGGGTSTASTFTVNPNPVPVVSSFSPAGAVVGGSAFTLTVNGTGFVPSSVVKWNGNARVTTFVSSTTLTAAIIAADVTNPANVPITVENPAPGGGASNSVTFPVQDNPVPVLSSISPGNAAIGSENLQITLQGSGYNVLST